MNCKHCIIEKNEQGNMYYCSLLKGIDNSKYFLTIRKAYLEKHPECRFPNNGECLWAYLKEQEDCPLYEIDK